jgi:AraC-like DNA-binding protein
VTLAEAIGAGDRNMLAIPLVRVFWGRPFLEFFRETGAPVDRYLEEARLAADVDRDPDLALPSRPLYGVLDRLARESGRRDIGLKVGERTRTRELGPFGRRVLAQETLGDAIAAAGKLMPSVHTARRITLSTTGRVARLSSRLEAAQLAPTLWGDQFALSLLVELVRLAAGSDWTPERVTVQAPLSGSAGPEAVPGGATVRYDADSTSVELPRALLSGRLGPAGDRGFDRTAARHPDGALGTLPTDFVGSLQVTLDTLVPQGYTDIRTLASVVGLSARSLQRRLSEHGSSFSELLARSRYTLARRRLLDPTAKVTDVAYEAGYSDATHFTRAFRRWAGVTPVAYRTTLTSVSASV